VERGEVIVRRGEPAHSMYFVTEGEVEIEWRPDQKLRRVRLGAGHFFGERAILREKRRSATITASVRTKLLVLDAADFKALMAEEVAIAEHVQKIVHQRMELNVEAGDGDLTSEEVASGNFI
jgi:voltage-gated potassium channel